MNFEEIPRQAYLKRFSEGLKGLQLNFMEIVGTQ